MKISMPIKNIIQPIQKELDATNNLIDKTIQSDAPLAKTIAKHIIHGGGKRIRPLLVLLSARAFHYEGQQHIHLAAIGELLHTATLLHDDVLDESELRRGIRTANAKWGNKASILVGDWLVTRAFQLLTELSPPKEYNRIITNITAKATTKTIEGEILQLNNIGNSRLDENTYLQILENKTGQLFEINAMTGPVLCERDQSEIDLMLEYGKNFGIAFQLIDDALDYIGSQKSIGKTVGDDLREGKITLPLIHALNHCNKTQKKSVQQIIKKRDKKQIKIIQTIIDETNAIDYTTNLARQYVTQALQSLTKLPTSISSKGLRDLAQWIVDRSK